ncbi:Putative hypothetical protein [Helicobacter mustelae 12198]|uniref:Uncharacterized protein n=1 Tax=Helicobacter mustelae (strain ATCC 43772 / CCUG 25715 / CIP 103759 / LMG 18044 / NCTC 12198 / R85-136P) TaxID=679897 RepID=D3UHU8_HELM1|nr:Putative hypothetical protein [Helicobacter mustelae 12198]
MGARFFKCAFERAYYSRKLCATQEGELWLLLSFWWAMGCASPALFLFPLKRLDFFQSLFFLNFFIRGFETLFFSLPCGESLSSTTREAPPFFFARAFFLPCGEFFSLTRGRGLYVQVWARASLVREVTPPPYPSPTPVRLYLIFIVGSGPQGFFKMLPLVPSCCNHCILIN